MQDIMTPEQVADYLQMNTNTIYRLIREKRLAATQIGRAYRIPREDLEDFLAANSSRPTVRETIFRSFMDIAKNNPGVSSDNVLQELESLDEERQQTKSRRV